MCDFTTAGTFDDLASIIQTDIRSMFPSMTVEIGMLSISFAGQFLPVPGFMPRP